MTVKSSMQVSIVLPTYNEEEAIGKVIDGLRTVLELTEMAYEILVIDDGSTDGTRKIAEQRGVRVVSHRRNYGVGRARKTGLKVAAAPIIVMTDADDTYPTAPIPQMIRMLEECDLVVGARRSEKGTTRWLRTPIKYLLRQLAAFIAGQPIPDLNSGLRAFRRDTALRFLNILPDTHSWVSTITLAYMCNDYEVLYLPIDYHPRIGHSTFHPITDTWNYLLQILRTVLFFRPLKFFLPLSIFLSLSGLAKFIFDWQVYSDVRESDIMIILVGILVGTIGTLSDLIVTSLKSQYLDTARHDDLDRGGTGVLPVEMR